MHGVLQEEVGVAVGVEVVVKVSDVGLIVVVVVVKIVDEGLAVVVVVVTDELDDDANLRRNAESNISDVWMSDTVLWM